MVQHKLLKARVQELTEMEWDIAAIEARYRKLAAQGIPRKKINRAKVIASKQQILERVQRQAEEYEYLSHS
jgi:hypothetical protein